jgi:hypothetical protein
VLQVAATYSNTKKRLVTGYKPIIIIKIIVNNGGAKIIVNNGGAN